MSNEEAWTGCEELRQVDSVRKGYICPYEHEVGHEYQGRDEDDWAEPEACVRAYVSMCASVVNRSPGRAAEGFE